jgi:hypothetical protein
MQRLRVSVGVGRDEHFMEKRLLIIADRMTDTCPLVSSSLPISRGIVYTKSLAMLSSRSSSRSSSSPQREISAVTTRVTLFLGQTP